VFESTCKWPREEKFALTDQVRRSARSIGANISEAWAKRRYEAHFVSKLTDSDAEANETEHWLACAVKHGYISKEEFLDLRSRLAEIGRMLGGMIAEPWKFLPKPRKVRPNPPS
jgi:four helix bundle protein